MKKAKCDHSQVVVYPIGSRTVAPESRFQSRGVLSDDTDSA